MSRHAFHGGMRTVSALGLASLITASSGCYVGAAWLPSANDATLSAIQPPEVDPVEYDPPVLVMPGPEPGNGLLEWVSQSVDQFGEGSLSLDPSVEGPQSLDLFPGL
jgi:hypothetical protein